MGRPLFLKHRQTPVVRVEPEEPQPQYEKWTYWNPFDPDSDEFFERDDAVYEAFVPEDAIALPPPSEIARIPSTSSSSAASSSGPASPAEEVRGRELSAEEIDLALRREAELIRIGAAREEEVARRVREARAAFVDVAPSASASAAAAGPHSERMQRFASEYLEMISSGSASADAGAIRAVRERVLPSPTPAVPSLMLASAHRPSTPPSQHAVYVRPSTPPNVTPTFEYEPSPPPTVTPRLYSWSRTPVLAAPSSPILSSPLTNRDARLSVEHIFTMPPAPLRRVAT